MYTLKGYYTNSCYMGWVGYEYRPFESESAYHEWCVDNNYISKEEEENGSSEEM